MNRLLLISQVSKRDQPNPLLFTSSGTCQHKIFHLCGMAISIKKNFIQLHLKEFVDILQNKERITSSKLLRMVGKSLILVMMMPPTSSRSTSLDQPAFLTQIQSTLLITSQQKVITGLWWTGCLFLMNALEGQENAQNYLKEIKMALQEHTVCIEPLENKTKSNYHLLQLVQNSLFLIMPSTSRLSLLLP